MLSIIILCRAIDIDCRNLNLSKKMEKTYVFDSGGNGNNNLAALLPALLQNRGIDPTALLAMSGGFGGMGGFGGLFGIVILFALLQQWGFGGFGGGFGGFGRGFGAGGFLPNQINNDANTAIILQALERNGVNINGIASTLGLSKDAIMSAINGVSREICSFAQTNGQNFNQVLMQLMNGNNALTSQIANCCCDLKQLVASVITNNDKNTSAVQLQAERNTCAITKSIDDSADRILAGQRAAEMREMQREIADRDRRLAEKDVIISEARQTSMVGQLVRQATEPLANTLGALINKVDKIECGLPPTVSVPYPQLTALNRCEAAVLGLNGNGIGWGVNGNGWG